MSGVELGVGYLTIIPSTRGFIGTLGKDLSAPMRSAGAEAGDSVGKGMSSRAKLIGAGVGLAIGAAVSKALTGAIDSQAATAKLGAQLGASAKDTKRYGKLAGRLYAQGYGEDLAGVNEAIKGVVLNIPGMDKASGKSLSSITKQVQSVASTFDQDLGQTTRAVGQLLRNGLAPDAEAALDIVVKGFQSGTNSADDLLDTFNEYSTQFRSLGLNGQEALGLINQMVKGGARDSDTAADALKEFGLATKGALEQTTNGQTVLTDLGSAFESVLPAGTDLYKVQEQLAGGGAGARKAFFTMVEGLKKIKDPSERSQASLALFGTKAEDTQAALLAMDSRTAVSALGKVEGASKKVDASTATAKNSITVFTRSLEQRLTNAGLKVLPTLVEVGGVLEDVFGPTLSQHAGLLTKVGLGLGAVAVSAKAVSLVASPFKAIIDGGRGAVGIAGKAGEAYKRFVAPGGGLDTVRLRAGQAGDGLRSIGGKARSGLATAASAMRTGAANALGLARSAGAASLAFGRQAVAAGRARIALIAQSVATRASAIATRGMAIAQGLLNVVMRANPIVRVITVVFALVAALVVAYKTSGTFRRIVGAVFSFIGARIRAVWVTVIRPTFSALKTFLTVTLPAGFTFLRGKVSAIFGAISGRIGDVWRTGIKPIFKALHTFITDTVVPKFQTAVDGIGKVWDGLKKLAATPVNFVIGTIYNNGLRKALNLIPGIDLAKAPLISMATGGVLPGYTPGRDVHHFTSPTGGRLQLSGGEAIMRPEFARAVGGARGVDRLNRLARKRTGLFDGAYAKGGIFRPVAGRTSGRIHGSPPAIDIATPVGSNVAAVQAGKISRSYDIRGNEPRAPHGGLGYRSYGRVITVAHDGFSTLYAHLSQRLAKAGQKVAGGQVIGKSGDTGHFFGPHVHFGSSGPNPNSFLGGSGKYTGAVSSAEAEAKAKWSDVLIKVPGQIKAVFGKVREMGSKGFPGLLAKAAKTIASRVVTWIDDRIPNRFLPDTPVRSALRKLGVFDAGGILPPGGAAFNLSGRPEAVFNDQQWSMISRAIAPTLSAPTDRGDAVTVELNGPITTVDVDELVRKQEAKMRRALLIARVR